MAVFLCVLKNYTVFIEGEEPVFVDGGFSYSCFFFTFFHLLINRLWGGASLVFLLAVGLYLLFDIGLIDLFRVSLLSLTLMTFCGFSFSFWKQEGLTSRGIQRLCHIYAGNLPEAKLQFYRMKEEEGESA